MLLAPSQPLTNFGVDPRNYVDPATDSTAMGRMLHHVGETKATPLRELRKVLGIALGG